MLRDEREVAFFGIECSGRGAQLVNVQDNRSELHAVTCHQTHGALDRCEMTEARELAER